MLCRSKIDDGGAEVSNVCHIWPTNSMAAIVIWAEYAWYKVVPFGETEANSSDRLIQSTSGSPWDLVMEMGELDLTGLALGNLGVKEPLFRAGRPQTGHSGLDRRLVPASASRLLNQ